MTTEETPHNPPFTNEEIVFLLKAVWAALQSPGWTFKNRKDLEKIGEAIFSGKELKDLDDALYDRIFPHLKTVAIHLGKTLRDTEPTAPSTPSEATSPAAPTTTVTTAAPAAPIAAVTTPPTAPAVENSTPQELPKGT